MVGGDCIDGGRANGRIGSHSERSAGRARLLQIEGGKSVFFQVLILESKKRPQPEPCHEDVTKGQREKEKRREAKERRKEGVALAQTADSRPRRHEKGVFL